MAVKRKRSPKGLPIEWIAAFRAKTANEGFTTETIDFEMDDDEVVEVKMVDSIGEITIGGAIITDVAKTLLQALYTDPTYAAGDPWANAAFEDIEQFYIHNHVTHVEAHDTAASVDQNYVSSAEKHVNFPEPGILLANNVSWMTGFDATDTQEYGIRIYFKRRKAGSDELARTLLKRR